MDSSMNIKVIVLTLSSLVLAAAAQAQVTLNERCVINILNRTIQVGENGGWALPNVPSNMGNVRARATCTLEDGTTVSGQSDYFNLTRDGISTVGEIKFEDVEAVPTEINFQPSGPIQLANVEQIKQLNAYAKYRDGDVKEITSSESGINYSTTNAGVATVDGNGIVTARGNGVAFINARKDGVLASQRISVISSGDGDADGMPDDWELANGLNPADPVDAFEDKDGDGLSNVDEFDEGTNPALADTDSDGLDDAKELKEHNTNPLLADTDGDGLNDRVELLTSTDPLIATSADYAAAVQSISTNPSRVVLTFNGVDSEVSKKITVTGLLIDGSSVDLTSRSRGTNYVSSDLSIVNFSSEDGRIFGGLNGNAVVTVTNGSRSVPIPVFVDSFTPSALSAITIPGFANNVAVAGDFAFVAAGDAGLQVVDVSNRRNPQIIGSLDTDGVSIDIRVRGQYIYLADGEAGLKIIDITDPSAPLLTGSLDTAGIAQDIQIQGDYVYIANGSAGIEIIDIRDPALPISMSVMTNLGVTKGIDVKDDLLVVVASSAFYTINISDPISPLKMGNVNLATPKDVVIDGDYAYVASYRNGYHVVDIKKVTVPTVVFRSGDLGATDIEISQGLALFAEQQFPNALGYVNISNPLEPIFQGTIDFFQLGDQKSFGIAIDASFAYVTGARAPQNVEFGGTGESKMFIAQYRMQNDNEGIPPFVEVTSPVLGHKVLEGGSIVFSANAQDDFAVAAVEFLIDGVVVAIDTTAPYDASINAPELKRFVNVQARATDLGGNVTTSEIVRLNIQPDKDKDGLGNDDEGDLYGTDPSIPDTDADGLTDGREVALGTNPLHADTDDDGVSDGAEVAQETDPFNPDVTKPTIVLTTPASSATNIPGNQGVVIKFSEPLSPKSISSSSITVSQSGFVPSTGKISVLGNGSELMFMPDAFLKNQTEFTVRIQGLRDLAGNRFDGPFEYTFTTGVLTDVVKPVVQVVTPLNNAVDVPVNSSVTFVMSEEIDASSIDPAKIFVRDSITSVTVAGTFSVSEAKTHITFYPSQPLLVGRKYNVTASGIKDLFSNLMSPVNYSFTTAFDLDKAEPRLIATTISHGDIGVPLNVKLRARFDEPVSGLSAQQISLLQNGNEVHVRRSLDNTGRIVILEPITPLSPNTDYVLNIGVVEDLSGNFSSRELQMSFITGVASDVVSGRSLKFSAQHQALVPLNFIPEAEFSEPVDPTYFPEGVKLLDVSESIWWSGSTTQARYIDGEAILSSDRKSVKFVPAKPLSNGKRYRLDSGAYSDVAGNSFSYFSYSFATADQPDQIAPVANFSFTSGTDNLAINSRFVVTLNEPFNRTCINSKTVKVFKAGEQVPIEGEIQLEEHYNRFIFTPKERLVTSTAYEFLVSGVCDLGGNILPDMRQLFATRSSNVLDTFGPSLESVLPERGATGIDANSKITLTFREPVELNIFTLQVKNMDGSQWGADLAGSWVSSGNSLEFTPSYPYPFGATIQIRGSVDDLAGNSGNVFDASFKVLDQIDTTPPQVIGITPSNGSMDIGQHAPIVITFSEPLRESTINSDNFFVFVDGEISHPRISRSIDNRSIILESPYSWSENSYLPSSKQVSVILTSDITDNAGNKLQDFASTFSTALLDQDFVRPKVVRQSPSSGSTNIRQLDHIVLYISKALNEGTLAEAVNVAANGVIVAGDLVLDSNNQAITFTPHDPLPENSLIEVHLNDSLKDSSGNLFTSYRGTFRTGSYAGSTPAVKPSVQAVYPVSGQVGVSLNPRIELSFNEVMNASSLNSTNVQLRKTSTSGTVISSLSSLSEDGLRLHIQPQTVLEVNTRYYIVLNSNIEDIDGDKATSSASFFFNTAADAVSDNQSPILLSSSPADGEMDVPVNPIFHLKFDEVIHPFSFISEGNEQVSFLVGNKEVRYMKNNVLPSNVQTQEVIKGILDASGNVMAQRTLSFTTTDIVDVLPPAVLATLPNVGAIEVPINTSVVVSLSEPISQLSVTSSVFYLFDTVLNKNVATNISVNQNAREIKLTPLNPLAVNRSYRVYISDLKDRSGNSLTHSFVFTTNFEADVAQPIITALGLDEAQVDVPLNARMRVRFNEAINPHRLSGVVVTQNGNAINVKKELSADGKLLTLTPPQLLQANSSYRFSVSSIEDLSGNTLSVSAAVNFTTGTKVDSSRNYIIASNPVPQTTNVPLNTQLELRFSEPLDPTINLHNNWLLRYARTVGGTQYSVDLDATLKLTPDRRNLLITPSEKLSSGRKYYINTPYELYDLAGNSVGGNSGSISFETGITDDVVSPVIKMTSFHSSAVNVPINTQIGFQFSESLNPLYVNSATVKLIHAGGEVVAGDVILAADGLSLLFIPKNTLLPSQSYTLSINGVKDHSGNLLEPFEHLFSTDNNAIADEAPPVISEAFVNLASQVFVGFSEPIDMTNIGGIQVTSPAISGQISGAWTQSSADSLTFSPTTDFPSAAEIFITFKGIRDLSGNIMPVDSLGFTSRSINDVTPPTILSMSPNNGAMDIGPLTPIVITFSESLKESTITNNNFMLYYDGAIYRPQVLRSPDNRTVTLTTTLPSLKNVSVIVTDDVMDNSGNRLTWFASTFNTAFIDGNLNRPTIVRQAPISGATNIRALDRITLYASEPLNIGSLNEGLYVAADGVLVEGQSSFDATGQALEFKPHQPLPENALIEVFLTDKLRGLTGLALTNYRGTFRTGSHSGGIVGTRPDVTAHYPVSGQIDVSLNPRIEVAFDQVMKAATLNADNIQLRRSSASGTIIPSLFTLSSDGLRLHIQPNSLLEAGVRYFINMNANIEDINGEKIISPRSFSFDTGTAGTVDNQLPMLTESTPSDGETGVPVNPTYHLRFDEPIHPFSFLAKADQQITFLAGNKEIRYTNASVMTPNTLVSESLSGISDASGNIMPNKQIRFTTTSSIDIESPKLVSTSPRAAAKSVPLNTLILLAYSDKIDSFSSTATLYDTVLKRNINISISNGENKQQLIITPLEVLIENREYAVTYSVKDYSNNKLDGSFRFTTGVGADIEPPAIDVFGINENQMDIPLNARLRVRFTEPINANKLAGARLFENGIPVSVSTEISAERTLLTLIPQQLLKANSNYTFQVSDIEDLSGNKLASVSESHFTTGSKIYASGPTVLTAPFKDRATNIPLNRALAMQFDKSPDETSVFRRSPTGLYEITKMLILAEGYSGAVPGQVVLSEDKKTITFVPSISLKPLTNYRLLYGGPHEFYDVVGNDYQSGEIRFSTASQ